jgi:hypothetical protein
MQQWPHHEGQHGDDDHHRYAGYGDLPGSSGEWRPG